LGSSLGVGLNNVGSEIVNFSFGNSISLGLSNKLERLLSATAAVLVGFGFLEEGEWLGNAGSTHGALAAFDFRNAVGIFTDKFALGFRAVGFVAFPVALGFLADRLAFWFGSLAVGDAVRLFANCNALGAVEHFAAFVGALDFTFGLFAFDIADCVFGFGAGSMAFGGFADWVANGWAVRVIALPGALGMAFAFGHESAAAY
jgi:hypothetical protein